MVTVREQAKGFVRWVRICLLAFISCVGVALLMVITSSDPRPAGREQGERVVTGCRSVRTEHARDLLTGVHAELPPLERCVARDGDTVTFRRYRGAGSAVFFLIHGSASHGAIWHDIAQGLISDPRVGQVIVPTLRGHWNSGTRRGDCSYVGQLSDDCADILHCCGVQHEPCVFVTYSGGAGVAIWYANTSLGQYVHRVVMIAPALPLHRTMRPRTMRSGWSVSLLGSNNGWSLIAWQRLLGLYLLGVVGMTGLQGLPVVHWNRKPERWNGCETLHYSYRLFLSMLPPVRWDSGLNTLERKVRVVAGSCDALMNVTRYQEIFGERNVTIIPELDHASVLHDEQTWRAILSGALPEYTDTSPDTPEVQR